MADNVTSSCCIAGGGPAGMMLGLLLARAGVDVVVLEKHADFFRDFRGDTIHPSTLQLMHELGLLSQFLALPHQEIREASVQIGDVSMRVVDLTHLPGACKFLVLMPQWDFLNFLAAEAKRYATFRLEMEAEVTGLLFDGERVAGVLCTTPGGPREFHAGLVVGCDGRSSVVRAAAGLEVLDIGAPMDVLWFRLSRKPADPTQILGRVEAGAFMIMLDRETYWQCGFVIPKGAFEPMKALGLDEFRARIVSLAPFASDRLGELASWDDVRLLTVAVDRLRTWYRDGLLCLGDAAHAMSPVGGVGINLAVQDAVAAANLLAVPLLREHGRVSTAELARVQRRRQFPTVATQRLQVFIQERAITRVLGGGKPIRPPFVVRLVDRFAFLRRIPALIVGLGFRPEHVRSPAAP